MTSVRLCLGVIAPVFLLGSGCGSDSVFGDSGLLGIDSGLGYSDQAPIEDPYGVSDVNGTITGTVTVQLYTEGKDGEREEISWDEATGGEYNLGSIWVGAYYTDDEGANKYVGQATVPDPSTSGDPYSMDVGLDSEGSVSVYAVVDYWQDNIVGSGEPKGVYPAEILITDGSTTEGVDITILAPVYSGGGGGCSSETVTISGDNVITDPYAGGDVATMLLNSSGEGPYHSTWGTPEAESNGGGGAIGAYELSTCASYGDMNLAAAWDANGNGMADPHDKWGVYITASDEEGNPITVGDNDLSGFDIQIPFGDDAGINLVPFVSLSGDLSYRDGTFDDLPDGTTAYVAALKYRPSAELTVSDLSGAYDIDTYTWEDLSGTSSQEFSLTVPSNTITYLWAYADMDANGIVNESGEPVASGGDDDNGKLTTAASVAGINMELAIAKE